MRRARRSRVSRRAERAPRTRAEGAAAGRCGFPLERGGYTDGHRKILKAAAAELGIPFLDLQPRMEQASRQAQLYFQNDRGHANAAGNSTIADWVFEFLVAEQLVDPQG